MANHPVRRAADGRHMYYVLDENGDPQPWEGDLIEWSDRLTALGDDRILADTHLPSGARVTTAFWGMDDAVALLRASDKPEVFGTLVWSEGFEYFDATRGDALARHKRIVEKLLRGQSLQDET